jgi:hypothetical protein
VKVSRTDAQITAAVFHFWGTLQQMLSGHPRSTNRDPCRRDCSVDLCTSEDTIDVIRFKNKVALVGHAIVVHGDRLVDDEGSGERPLVTRTKNGAVSEEPVVRSERQVSP